MLITARLRNAPEKTTSFDCRMARIAAIKKVLSPISDRIIMLKDEYRARGSVLRAERGDREERERETVELSEPPIRRERSLSWVAFEAAEEADWRASISS